MNMTSLPTSIAANGSSPIAADEMPQSDLSLHIPELPARTNTRRCSVCSYASTLLRKTHILVDFLNSSLQDHGAHGTGFTKMK